MMTVDLWRNTIIQRIPALTACLVGGTLVVLSPDYDLHTYCQSSLYAESVNDYNAYVSNSK